MEDKEKKHIFKNFTELVDNTIWNTACLTVPIQTGVFGNDDTSLLESIPDKRMRILEFYRLFMKKHNSYQHLIATLEKGHQTGAATILCGLHPTKYSLQFQQQMSSRSTNEGDGTVRDFGQPAAAFTTNQDSYQHQIAVPDNHSQRGAEKDPQTFQQLASKSEKSQSSVRFDVQNPPRLFTGRMKELSELHEKLKQSKNKPAVVSQMASVAGLGGIGKTELARMYIQKYSEQYDNNVIWISAETEETLTEGFRRLASDFLYLNQTNADGKDKHLRTLIYEVYNFFEHKTCLFVFDNAESNEDIQKFLPLQVPDPPFVLITSRDRDWSFGVEMLELNEMEELDAIAFVRYGINIQHPDQDEYIVKLVKTLQCFPLAISQAISYIKEQQMSHIYSISQYLDEYQSCSGKLLSRNACPKALNNYSETTSTTWKLTTKKILENKDCGKEAIRMLNMISYFQPEKIPREILIAGKSEEFCIEIAPPKNIGMLSRIVKLVCRSGRIMAYAPANVYYSTDPEKNENALKLLGKYSMVNIQVAEQTISIHRLLQEVTRIELRRNEQEEATLEHALQLLSGNLERTCTCINHFCSVYKYCQAYKTLVVDFKDVPWRILKTLDNDSTSIRYYSGVSVGNELKETLQKHVSSGDVDVIRLKRYIAMANYRVGNYEAAVQTFEESLPTYFENNTGLFTKKETLNFQLFLSACLKELGKRSESLRTLLQTYESSKVVYGLNDWWTVQTLVETANCLHELGHFKKSFVQNAEYLQVLNQDSSVLDPLKIPSLLKAAYENNKHLISSDSKHSNLMHSIAAFFIGIGDNDTASTIANDVFEIGRNSNDTKIQFDAINCLNLLGVMKSNEGKHEDALETFKELHIFFSKTLGSSHVSTLTYKRNMLTELRHLGKPEAALVGLHEVLETLTKNYPNHPDVFWTEWHIGVTLFDLKRHEESLALLVNLRKRIEDRFGHTDPLLPDVTASIERIKKFVVNEDLTHHKYK